MNGTVFSLLTPEVVSLAGVSSVSSSLSFLNSFISTWCIILGLSYVASNPKKAKYVLRKTPLP